MTKLAIINKDTNLVENTSIDDRPISEIVLPEPYFVINLDETIAILYTKNPETKEIIATEVLGAGGIGFTWNGEKLVGQQPNNI